MSRFGIAPRGIQGPCSFFLRNLGCDFARANLSLFRRNDQLPSGMAFMSGNISSSNIEDSDIQEYDSCRSRAGLLTVGGSWAERDRTRGRRVSGDCNGSIFGLVCSVPEVDGDGEFAARAAADRSDDALGGGRGGACPNEGKDVDDGCFVPMAIGASTDVKDVDDASPSSEDNRDCSSETNDVVDTIL